MHTIGNLTLTNCNQQLNNKTFNEKIVILKERDNFPLNNYFSNLTKWNELEMNKWANHLLDLSNKIWNFDHLKNCSNHIYTKNTKLKQYYEFYPSNDFKNYDFSKDINYKSAIINKTYFRKTKHKFNIYIIKKIIELFVVDNCGYKDIEKYLFGVEFDGWLGQSIIEALLIDKEYDKGKIEQGDLNQYINLKKDRIYLLLEFANLL